MEQTPSSGVGKDEQVLPRGGDLLPDEVIPHPMSSNFRTAEKDFSADVCVWEHPTWRDFSPTPTPHLSQERAVELLGCRKAENLFPNASQCCLVTACQIRCWKMLRSVGLKGGI